MSGIFLFEASKKSRGVPLGNALEIGDWIDRDHFFNKLES